MGTYPISDLVVFQASSSSIEDIDGTLLGAGVAVILVQILFDSVFEFLPVIVLFCLLRLDLMPLFGAVVRLRIVAKITTLGIVRL